MNHKQVLLAISLLLVQFSNAQQNVGIGTTAPAEKLHVIGNVKADTLKPNAIKLTPNAGEGKLLTSDAAGNARWAEANAQSGATAGNLGYGVWGDCATNGNISEYYPVTDSTNSGLVYFGKSVSISGDFAFVGMPMANQGVVVVYKYENNRWNLFTKLTDPTGATGDQFGWSVAVEGNYTIIGSRNDMVGTNANQGSASIYQYNGTSWVWMQKITDATGDAGDAFGYNVAISGNRVVVGSPYDDNGTNTDRGCINIFQLNGSAWVLMQKITTAGITGDNFGMSVAISGNRVIAGSPGFNEGAVSDAGQASIYHFNGTTWALALKITNPTSEPDDDFGRSVAIYNNHAVVGRPGRASEIGDAIVYFYNGTVWTELMQLSKPAFEAGDRFGSTIAISGNYMMIGVPLDDVGSQANEGGVALFARIGNYWQQQQYITDPSGKEANQVGDAVAIDGSSKRFVIGVPSAFAPTGKALFGKIN